MIVLQQYKNPLNLQNILQNVGKNCPNTSTSCEQNTQVKKVKCQYCALIAVPLFSPFCFLFSKHFWNIFLPRAFYKTDSYKIRFKKEKETTALVVLHHSTYSLYCERGKVCTK